MTLLISHSQALDEMYNTEKNETHDITITSECLSCGGLDVFKSWLLPNFGDNFGSQGQCHICNDKDNQAVIKIVIDGANVI